MKSGRAFLDEADTRPYPRRDLARSSTDGGHSQAAARSVRVPAGFATSPSLATSRLVAPTACLSRQGGNLPPSQRAALGAIFARVD